MINDYNPVRRARALAEEGEPMIAIGEAFEGDGANAAHINLVLGPKDELFPHIQLRYTCCLASHAGRRQCPTKGPARDASLRR